jgi:hypothetical protein
MTYAEWSERTLAANRLQDIIESFVASGERVWYVHRHVLDVGEGVPPLEDATGPDAACRVALSLFRTWLAFAIEDRRDSVLVACPILVIDDAWLDGVASAPPHVVSTIARHARYLAPHVVRADGREPPKELWNLLAGSGLCLEHIAGEDGGAWFIWDSAPGAG